jgi:hypothetical protein
MVDGQLLPPFAASALTLLSRLCMPPPQLLEHVDHASHSNLQSTGQALKLQTWVSVPVPQEFPPSAAEVMTLRDLVRTPPLHSAEHVSHWLKADILQSTFGQLTSLQMRCSLEGQPLRTIALSRV